LRKFYRLLADQGLAETYEAAHARLAIECLATTHARLRLLDQGKLKLLTNLVSQAAADQLFLDTARKLANGLSRLLATDEDSPDSQKKRVGQLWKQSATDSQ